MERERSNKTNFKQQSASLPWKPLVIILILVVAIIGSGFIYYKTQKRSVFKDQVHQLDAIADLKAAEITNWLGERLGDAKHSAENPIVKEELLAFLGESPAGRRRESIQGWMASLQKHYHYENVLLLDLQGIVVLSASAHHNEIGPEGRKTLEEARMRRDTVISDLHENPSVPHVHFDIVTPLLAGDEAAAFLLLRIDPGQFIFPLIQSWPTPSPSAETLLIRRAGEDVLFLNELRHKKNTTMRLRLPLHSQDLPAAQAALGRRGPFFGRDYRGIPVWAVSRPIKGTTWSMVAKVDRDEIERPLRNRALAIFLVVLSLVLSAAGMALFFWQRQNSRFIIGQLAAETARRQDETFIRTVLDSLPIGVAVNSVDPAVAFAYMNDNFPLFYRTTREKLMVPNMFWDSVYEDPDFREEIQNRVLADCAGRDPQQMIWSDVPLTRRGEATSFISARNVPIPGREEMISMVWDVSEHKRAEDALRESEENFKQVFETANVGKSITLPSGEINVNKAFCNMLGYSNEELRNKKWQEITPAEDVGAVQKMIEPLLQGQRDTARFNKRYIHKDGSIVWADVSVAMRRDAKGKPLHFITTVVDISERRQAEERLEENLALLRIAGEMARLGGWNVNLEENRCYWSDEVAAIHEMPSGYSPLVEEGINFYAPEWRKKITEVFSACAQKGIPYNEEMEIVTAKGKRRWVQTIGEAVRDDTGRIFKVQGAFQDITERKQAEKDLQQLSERNQALLEAVPDIIMEVDANKVYTWANQAGVEFFGTDVIGREAAYYFEGEQKTYQLVKPLFNGHNEIIYVESWQRRRDGEKRLLAWWCRVLKDDGGKVIGALSSGRDITDMRHAEEALRESERKFRETVITLDEGFYSVTLDGKLLEHNQSFNRILEFDIGQDLRGIQLPDFWQVPEARKEYLKAFSASGSISNYQIEAKTQKGARITVLASAHLVKDKTGKPARIEGVFLDISERIRAEAEILRLNEELEQRVQQRTSQLAAANKELEAFSYSVSHDLRAPLRAIDGFSRIILEDYAPRLDKEGKRLFDVITANIHKMGLLIDDLLAFSRLSRQPLAVATVNLGVMARVVYAELKKQETGRHIDFKVGALPAAFGDYAMLQQVLQNLLANAVKFTRPRKMAHIEFGARTEKTENVYFIRDNGVGFDMQYANKLFSVFQRLHSADEFEGTGVGLAIVQRIILRHGGRVWAESKEGKGATFYFSLPQEKGLGARV